MWIRAAILAIAALALVGCETMECGTDSGPKQGGGCSAHQKF